MFIFEWRYEPRWGDFPRDVSISLRLSCSSLQYWIMPRTYLNESLYLASFVQRHQTLLWNTPTKTLTTSPLLCTWQLQLRLNRFHQNRFLRKPRARRCRLVVAFYLDDIRYLVMWRGLARARAKQWLWQLGSSLTATLRTYLV